MSFLRKLLRNWFFGDTTVSIVTFLCATYYTSYDVYLKDLDNDPGKSGPQNAWVDAHPVVFPTSLLLLLVLTGGHLIYKVRDKGIAKTTNGLMELLLSQFFSESLLREKHLRELARSRQTQKQESQLSEHRVQPSEQEWVKQACEKSETRIGVLLNSAISLLQQRFGANPLETDIIVLRQKTSSKDWELVFSWRKDFPHSRFARVTGRGSAAEAVTISGIPIFYPSKKKAVKRGLKYQWDEKDDQKGDGSFYTSRFNGPVSDVYNISIATFGTTLCSEGDDICELVKTTLGILTKSIEAEIAAASEDGIVDNLIARRLAGLPSK